LGIDRASFSAESARWIHDRDLRSVGLNQPFRTLTEDPATLNCKKQAHSVTVVICTRDRPALLERCLAAVNRLDPAPHKVVVIDNSVGNNETFQVAARLGARYAIEPVRGLSRARNRGLRECDTDLVAFLDDDVIPEPEWLGLLLVPFADEQTGATTGSVITPESQNPGALEQSSRALTNQDRLWFEIATFGGLGFGANMAFRKSFLPLQAFFDERLGRGAPFEGGEESYAFAWLLSRGFRVVYVPSAIVHHPPLSRSSIEREARNYFAYWLLLLAEFPGQRMDAFRFLIRRLRGKPLEWPRNPQEPGEVVSSSWRILLPAAIKGFWLFASTSVLHRPEKT
jgi:cellulose synthase/poly-beta-1,6-N-acetylglucosamine synthase-like glycosyltransferase